jgi:hypothetical protein
MTANSDRAAAVGVFADPRRAQDAVAELQRAAFREDQIGIVGRHPAGAEPHEAAPDRKAESLVAEGTGAGAAVGAGLGMLWGLGIAAGMLPAIGTVVVGGTMMGILASAGGGAALGTLIGALVGLGVPLEEAHYYHDQLQTGHTLVAVRAEGRHDEARAILAHHGGFDREPGSPPSPAPGPSAGARPNGGHPNSRSNA